MKKVLLTMSIACCCASVSFAQASKSERGQATAQNRGTRSMAGATSTDAKNILLACINQPAFEKYYASNGADGVNVVDLPGSIVLPAESRALGRTLRFKTAEHANSGSLSNYFYFGDVQSNNEQVSVSMTYFYNHSAEGYKVVMVDVQLKKNGTQYQIINANFQGDLL
jgi:hypothetical protein